MDITLNIPQIKAEKELTTIAFYCGYKATIKDETGKSVPNPQTKIDFCRELIRDYWNKLYEAGEVKRQLTATREATIILANNYTNDTTIK